MAVMGEASTFGGTFRGTDQAGLIVAIALHAALVGALALQISFRTEPEFVGSESMSVNLATEVSLESTAPDAVAVARAESAPVLGENPPDVENFEEANPTEPNTPTQPTSTPTSRPTTRSSPTARNSPKPRNTPTSSPTRSNSGSNQFDNAFNTGAGDSSSSEDELLPASQIGASAKASIQSQISKELRPHWRGKAPTGSDADKLVTIVAFRLKPDGSLDGRPRVVRQTGVTPSNESQKGRHAEIALRAVRLAAPFDLPKQYYNAWKSIKALSFDRKL